MKWGKHGPSDPAEERGCRRTGLLEGTTMGTQRPVTTGTSSPETVSTVSTKLERIANLAKRVREPLTTLAHHIDLAWMREAYRRTRKDGAPGVDGVTAEAYAANLEANL